MTASHTTKHQENIFHSLIENSSEIITILNQDGKIRYSNSATFRILGYTQEDLVNKVYQDFIHPDQRTTFDYHFERRIRLPGLAWSLSPYRFRHADGSWVYLESNAKNLLSDPVVQGVVINARNISERRTIEETLQFRSGFDNLIKTISSSFINCPIDSIDSGIRKTLQQTGSFVGADRSYVFMFSPDETLMNNTHEWCADGITPQIDHLQGVPSEAMAWWVSRLRRNETIHIPSVSDLPPEATNEKNLLEAQDIQSVAVVPMIHHHSLRGFLGFDAVRQKRDWDRGTIDLLRIIGEITINALERKLTEESLIRKSEELALLTNTVPNQIWYLKDEETYGLVNQAHADFLGKTKKELEHRSLHTFLSKKEAQTCTEGNRLVFELKQSISAEETVLNGKGAPRILSITKTPKLDPFGQVEFVVCSAEDITDRKKSEERLRKSEERYHLLFTQMLEGFALHEIICDQAGTPVDYRFLEVNPAFEKMTGLQASQITGKTVLEVLPQTERVWIDKYGEVALTGQPIQFDQYAESFNRFYRVTAYSPQFGQFVTSFSDITEQKEAEEKLKTMNLELEQKVSERTIELTKSNQALQGEVNQHLQTVQALRESEDRFRGLVNSMDDFVFTIDPQFRFTGMYRSWIDQTGSSPEDIIGKTFREVLGTELALVHEQAVRQALKDLHVAYIWQAEHPTGIRHYQTTLSPLRNQNSQITGFVGVSRDISSLKQVEEALCREKDRLNITLQSIGDGVIATDTSGTVILMNQSAERITGIQQAEGTGKKINQILAVKAEAMQYLDSLIDQSENRTIQHPLYLETPLVQSDQKWLVITLTSTPIVDEHGRTQGYVIVIRDITEQKKHESREALSQKMESIGRLAAGIAHEINTPMQFVGDNARFLQQAFQDINSLCDLYHQIIESVDQPNHRCHLLISQSIQQEHELDLPYLLEEIPKALEESLEGISRVSKLVLAMKNFSHPGIKELSMSNLNQAIQDTVTVSRNEWKYCAELVTDLDPAIPPILCSIDEINQVILNMIINSVNAIEEMIQRGSYTKGQILIQTRMAGHSAEIRISDNGSGIPAHLRNQIFEPFFTTKQVGKGTGQGLSIAHDVIVTKHGGTIQIDTEQKTGTTFVITIPLENNDLT